MLIAAASSDDDVPKLVTFVSQLLAAAFVLCVIAGVVLVLLVVANKMGRRPFGLLIDPGKLGLIAVGALILGSVSGGVLWGSGLYAPAKVAEPQKVTPAYEQINDCQSKGLKVADDPDKAKKVLGQSKYNELNDKMNGQITNTDDGLGKLWKDTFIDYKPTKKGNDCGDEIDSCYRIKLTFQMYDASAIFSKWQEESSWTDAETYDSGSCGPAQQF